MPLLSDRQAPLAAPKREHPVEVPTAGIGIPSCPHLRGLHRASLCCGAEVIHPLKRSDEVICERCGRVIEIHAVLNSDGERIWPVPAEFLMKSGAPPAPPAGDPEAFPEPFPVHLPAHLRRHRIPSNRLF